MQSIILHVSSQPAVVLDHVQTAWWDTPVLERRRVQPLYKALRPQLHVLALH